VVLVALGVMVACGGDQPVDVDPGTAAERVSTTAADAESGGGGDASSDDATVRESTSARDLVTAERARCGGAPRTDKRRIRTTIAKLPPTLPERQAEAFRKDVGGDLVPLIAERMLSLARLKATVAVPATLDGSVALVAAGAKTQLGLTLAGASKTDAEVADGFVVQRAS
jgi:hypothetical protein